MPRAKTVTMGKLSPQEAHSSAIVQSIRNNLPHTVVRGDVINRDPGKYYVVYKAPKGGDRKVVAERSIRANATRLRDMLDEAWAEGYYSSGREKTS